MAYYKVVLKAGHLGAGKSYDLVKFFWASDIMEAFTSALVMPKVKKNKNGTSVYLVEKVSQQKYLRGKKEEEKDPYLN